MKNWVLEVRRVYSKGFIFISEHTDESVNEIESHDVVFLEEFPTKSEVNNGSELYELKDPKNVVLNTPVYVEEELIHAFDNSESDIPNDGQNNLGFL